MKSPHGSYRKCPWKLIYIEEMENKSKALQHEKRIKKYNRSKLAELFNSKDNIVLRFIIQLVRMPLCHPDQGQAFSLKIILVI